MRYSGYKSGRQKRLRIVSLLLAFIFMLTACGSGAQEGGTGTGGGLGEDGSGEDNYVYVPKFTEIQFPENCNIDSAKFVGNSLYYLAELFGEGDAPNRRILYEYSLTEGKNVREILICEGMGHTYDFWVREDGWVYVNDCPFFGTVSEDGNYGQGEFLFQILVYDDMGNLQQTLDLLALGTRSQWAPVVDGEKRIYLPLGGEDVMLLDADGTYWGEVQVEGWVTAAGIGPDGEVYVCCDNNTLEKIDFEAKEAEIVAEDVPVSFSYYLPAGTEYDLLIDNRTTLVGYDMETQTFREILRWIDYDMSSDDVNAFCQREDGGFLVLFNSRNPGSRELVTLTKEDPATLPDKTELVVGTIQMDSELERVVSDFNRRSDTIHVTVRNYGEAWDNGRDPYTDLNLDIVSAHDCPDIINLANLDIEALAGNGVFEDLNPWLEQSTVLDREDYLENILDSYTCSDILVAIPLSVTLDTFTARTSIVGERTGWTLEEFLDCAEAHPEETLYGPWSHNNSRGSVLYNCLLFGQSTFVDSETGICSFDSEEFKRLLSFAAGFSGDLELGSEDISVPQQARSGQVLLLQQNLNNFHDIQLYQAMYGGEDVTFIGYPTADGSGGHVLFSWNAYAIAAGSRNKEAAWSFIEAFLNQKVTDSFRLPTNREDLLERATAAEYVMREDGRYMLNTAGKPWSRFSTTSYDGWKYQYHPVTEEETAIMLNLLETARRRTSMDSTIYSIIAEEASAFFQGQKTVDEVAEVIQNKVQLYLDENR